mgnify:CR=1 FL=1
MNIEREFQRTIPLHQHQVRKKYRSFFCLEFLQCLTRHRGERLSNDCSSKHLSSSPKNSVYKTPSTLFFLARMIELSEATSLSSVRHAILWRVHRRSWRITKKVHRSPNIPRESIMLRSQFFNTTHRSCVRRILCLCQVTFDRSE